MWGGVAFVLEVVSEFLLACWLACLSSVTGNEAVTSLCLVGLTFGGLSLHCAVIVYCLDRWLVGAILGTGCWGLFTNGTSRV